MNGRSSRVPAAGASAAEPEKARELVVRTTTTIPRRAVPQRVGHGLKRFSTAVKGDVVAATPQLGDEPVLRQAENSSTINTRSRPPTTRLLPGSRRAAD